MPAKNTTHRPRLARDVYSTVERVVEIAANPEAFPEAEDLIVDIMMEMSSNTQVWLDHPDIIRPFLLACARLGTGEALTRFSELRQVCHFAGSNAAVKDLRRRLRYHDDEDDETDETPASADDSSAKVVDLSTWAQSHPRPVRNLLFAEKQ
jgi:hypothetical protein